jgi:hypothetical protein
MLASLLSKWPQLTAGNEIAPPKVPVAGCLLSCSAGAEGIRPAQMPLGEPFPLRRTAGLEVLPATAMPAKPRLGEGWPSPWRVGATDDPRTKPVTGAQPRGATSSPAPAWEVTLSARVAIRPMRLGRPADRLPLRLALAAGTDAPATELFPAVRLWRRAPLSPATMAGWKYGVLLCRGARAEAPAGTPLEWAGVVRQPSVPVTVPDVRSSGSRGVFGCAPVVRSGWRITGPASAAPVEFLEKGRGLLACEYRTRSML